MLRRVAHLNTELQPPVAHFFLGSATFRSMEQEIRKWDAYWRDVCAPVVERAKREAGSPVDEDTAAAVNELQSRSAERGQVNHWINGKREPTINQFMALCEVLQVDPHATLRGVFQKALTPPKHAPKVTRRAEPRGGTLVVQIKKSGADHSAGAARRGASRPQNSKGATPSAKKGARGRNTGTSIRRP